MESATASGRRELEVRLVEKAWKDPEFRREIVTDPKGMLEKYLGQRLPEKLKIFVHEEDSNTLHLSIPLAPSNLTELSDDDLEKVAGGTEFFLAATIAAGLAAVASAMGSVAGVTKTQVGW